MDARSARSRRRLTTAVIALASEQPIGEVTAAAVAVEAEVNRSTFYQHAESPAALLRTALRDELDAIRSVYVAAAPPDAVAEAVSASTFRVIDHVEHHAVIYERELSPAACSGVGAMLTQHLAESIRLLVELGAVRIPRIERHPRPESLADAVAHVVAAGAVGAIGLWLREPEPRDRDLLVAHWRVALPAWWPAESARLEHGQPRAEGRPRLRESGVQR